MVFFFAALAFIFYHDTSTMTMIVMSSVEILLLLITAILVFGAGRLGRVIFRTTSRAKSDEKQGDRIFRRVWEAIKRVVRRKAVTVEDQVLPSIGTDVSSVSSVEKPDLEADFHHECQILPIRTSSLSSCYHSPWMHKGGTFANVDETTERFGSHSIPRFDV